MTEIELISEFMGIQTRGLGLSVRYLCDEDGQLPDDPIVYNPSRNWNQLMPVVEKIGKIMNKFEKRPFYEMDEAREILQSLGDCLCQADILNANKKVTEFIKWFNTQKGTKVN